MRSFSSGIHTLRHLAWGLVLAVAVTSSSSAGVIADEFKAGVLGLRWGSDIEAVVAAFPAGTHWPVTRGAHREAERFYTVADDLPLVDIERKNQSTMFGFDRSNRLAMAIFAMPYDQKDTLLARATAIFGPPADVRVSGLQIHNVWRTDEGVTLAIFEIPHKEHGALFLVVNASDSLMKRVTPASSQRVGANAGDKVPASITPQRVAQRGR